MSFLRKFIIPALFLLLISLIITARPKWQSSQELDLNLRVVEYIELRLPDSINMDVKVGEDQSIAVDFFLRTNCRVNLTLESAGFVDENQEKVSILNNYVEYSLDGFFDGKKASFAKATFRVKPGTKYNGKFRVKWLGTSFAEDEWQIVNRGDYQDTITVTVSY
ncbi:MAG: hypothetical protein WAP36_09380 [Halanaerobiales bacterium]|jgi:hypothetical protein|nr:hypothetical protein [Bacillota bacterium]HOA41676.1 hypothetical protein [Halanaerobiales bacterium]HPZ62911.1 hypothetical protein [Halanaerobiales bacterium]HQD04090.1 hypothetical protein [Halanaerobiales bacterium]